MDNFSASARILPGIGAPGTSPVASGSFDMGSIPGFHIFQTLFLKLGLDPSFLVVTLGMSVTLITSLLSFFTYSFGSLSTLTRFVSANLVSTATIHSSDVTYLYVMRWLAVNKVSTDCRLFCVTSRKNPQSYAVRRYSSYSPYGDGSRAHQDDEDDELDEHGPEDDNLGPRLKYTPAPGFLHFWHKGRPIIINRKLDLSYYTGDIPDETIVLTTIGRSPTFLREILIEARRDYLQAQSWKTMVYTLSPTPFAQKNWDQGRHRPSRDISTVIMPQESKKLLLNDVKDYLNPRTMRWYAQRGLPYRRGYLFYGPPGTGKTSLSLALAGDLKLPLYILSLSTGSLTDETLTSLFVGLPRKCIVLLEDIDCAGVRRGGEGRGFDNAESEDTDDDSCPDSDWESFDSDDSDETDTTNTAARKNTGGGKNSSSTVKPTSGAPGIKSKSSSSPNSKDSSKNSPPPSSGSRRSRTSVSFSGLLNAIDGVASHEGRILIMTTNHREQLDPALIRPGRVDVQIEFGYAVHCTLAEIFRELYKEIGTRSSVSGEKASSGMGRERVNQLANDFADRIPEGRFTPAEIQGFLMSYKGQPDRALEHIETWVRTKTRPKKEKKRRTKRQPITPPSPPIIEPEKPEFPAATAPSINAVAADPKLLTHGILQHIPGDESMDLKQFANILGELMCVVEKRLQAAPLPNGHKPEINGYVNGNGCLGGGDSDSDDNRAER